MAKFPFDVAVAFATQGAEGVYNPTLDVIAGALADTDGLVLGHAGSGQRQSGLTFALSRESEAKAFIGASLSRPLSDFLRVHPSTFTFAFPFCGNRKNASNPPVDGDAVPIVGIDAILAGAGLVGAAWGSGVGHRYLLGAPNPISALVYLQGNRYELLDCRVALQISFPPGGIPIATAAIAVGSIKDHGLAALPTLDYGEQASVSAPTVVAVGNQWQETRGFSQGVLSIAQAIQDFGDTNALTGFVKEINDRTVTFEGTLYADDTVDKGYEYSQLIAAAEGTLDPLQWTVGAAMTAGNPAKAVRYRMPLPELPEAAIEPIGQKAAHKVTLIGRGAAAGSGNDELELIFL